MQKPGNRNKTLVEELHLLIKCNDMLKVKSSFEAALPDADGRRGISVCCRWVVTPLCAATRSRRTVPGWTPDPTDQSNGERTVKIKNSIAPGFMDDHGNRLFSNTIRSAEGEALVERLNTMFEQANRTGRVVDQRELSTVLYAQRSEDSAGDRSISAPERLLRATEGLSYESFSLLILAAEHLLRSEGKFVDPLPSHEG